MDATGEGKGIKTVGKYRLIKEIGRGAAGIVFEAIDDSNQKKFAIKSMSTEAIKRNKAKEKEIFNTFKTEMKILKDLKHQNIIQIFGVERTPNNIYLILEYINGGNLSEYLNFYNKTYKETLPEKTIQFLIRQIARGLEYLHSKKIAHRDLKLENILIHFPQERNVDLKSVSIDESIVKIADLGYAKDLTCNLGSTICGTALNMGPEMVANYKGRSESKTYNTSVDLWSLGTITYELLCGYPPFYGTSYDELFDEILKGKYEMPSNKMISLEIITFLNGLLQFDPKKRLTWDQIKEHPFIKTKAKDFHYVEVENIKPDKNLKTKLEIDSKDPNNFLWALLKPKEVENLDKIDEQIFTDEVVLGTCIIKNDPDEQREVVVDVRLPSVEAVSVPAINPSHKHDEEKGRIYSAEAVEKKSEPKDNFEEFIEDWENVSTRSFIILEEDDKEMMIGHIENYSVKVDFIK